MFVGSKEFCCVICGRRYKSYRALWAHKKYDCQKQRQFFCPDCLRRFPRKHHLINHLMGVHPYFDITTLDDKIAKLKKGFN